jgi:hypothetical protein
MSTRSCVKKRIPCALLGQFLSIRLNQVTELINDYRYAYKYRCPQIFCFDGSLLVLLQFKAYRLEDLKDEACPVDCWAIPIEGSSCSLRYGLHRFLAQGWRRCQGEFAAHFSVGGLTPYSREFYIGLPIWKIDGRKQKSHPAGYRRAVHGESGALMWTHDVHPIEWETGAFW